MRPQLIVDKNEKSQICSFILRSLPNWFGIESAIIDYVDAVREFRMWASYNENQVIGFISVQMHNPSSMEVHVMGVLENFHNRKIGSSLLNAAVQNLKIENVEYLQVKTLSEKHPDMHYAKTRKFYEKMGFVPVQEFSLLWGKDNPCVQMILKI